MSRRTFALAIALMLTATALPLLAGTVVAPGSGKSTVNQSLTVEPGTAVRDVETVNGSIEIGDGGRAGKVSTINGSIRLGRDASARSIETVNGDIRAGDGLAVAEDVETVNGSIELGSGAVVGGSLRTVDGGIRASQGEVRGDVETVNGKLALSALRIGGDVELVQGRLELQDASIVAGDVRVHQPKLSSGGWGRKPKPPVVIIGAGSEVRGRVIIENPDTQLYIHETARVGAVEGATAQRFQAAAPE
jgi:DUF4097 and DUF4098 domain-containing protein YvlB